MTSAVSNATHLSEIRFPEFTASLINGTFDALISSNIRQMTAYVDLMRMVGQSLSDYINNTRDDITGDEVLAFLEKILPAYVSDTNNTTHVHTGSTLTAPQTKVLNDAIALPADASQAAPTISAGQLDASEMTQIINAVTNRLACNKYTLLKEMVKQGILRLVIETGTIETRLTFSAYDYSSNTRNTSNYQRDASSQRKVGTSGVFQTLFSGPSLSSSSNTHLHVTTANETQRDVSGSSVNIFGGVTLRFKTDYLPLAE
jgi:hypothetical protein